MGGDVGRLKRRGGDLNVLRDIDDDRAGAAGGGDVERLMHDMGELGGRLHQIVMLRAMAGEADRVRFLKRVGTDEVRRDLPGDDDHRDGVHQCVGDAGDRVGGAGAGGDEDDAGLAGGAGIAFRHMGRALFMADQHMLDLRVVVEDVVNGQHRAARIAEHDFDPQIDQALHQQVRAAHFGHTQSP